jgi:hypothetical protein
MKENDYIFTPEEAAVVADYEATFRTLQNQLEGALRMIAGSHGLTGNWKRQGMTLVKEEEVLL